VAAGATASPADMATAAMWPVSTPVWGWFSLGT